MKTSKQLQDIMSMYLRNGITVTYLCSSVEECRYTMRLMADMYRVARVSMSHYEIEFDFAAAPMRFKSCSSPPHTLQGYKDLIIPDHNAFRHNNPDVPEFKEYIRRSFERNGILYEDHKPNGYRPAFGRLASARWLQERRS